MREQQPKADESPEPFRDDDAELALLGSVVATPEHFPIVRARVVVLDFGNSAIGVVWSLICTLADASRPISLTAIASDLRAANALKTIEAAVPLNALPHMMVPLSHAEDHARTVARNGRARRMLRAMYREVMRAQSPCDPDAFVASALATLNESSSSTDVHEGEDMETLAHSLFARIVDGKRGELVGARCGLEEVDQRTAGLKDGHLIVLAARPGMGKTSLAMQIAEAVATHYGPVQVFSAEMPNAELFTRMVCAGASIDSTRVDSNMLEAHEYAAAERAASHLVKLPIRMIDVSNITVTAIRAAALVHRSKHRTRLVVIDHLHCLKLREDPRDRRSDAALTGEATRTLKQLAKELGCPILLLAQLNRDCERRDNKRPIQADLLDSGRIEADADGIWFLYRDDHYKRRSQLAGISELNIAKQRGGKTGTVFLRFEREFTRFRDLDSEERDQVETWKRAKSSGNRYGQPSHTSEQDDAAE